MLTMLDHFGKVIKPGIIVRVINDVIDMAFLSTANNSQVAHLKKDDIIVCIDVRLRSNNDKLGESLRDEMIFLHPKHGPVWLGQEDLVHTEVV